MYRVSLGTWSFPLAASMCRVGRLGLGVSGAGRMCRVGRRWTWAFSTSGGVYRVSGLGLAGLALVRGLCVRWYAFSPNPMLWNQWTTALGPVAGCFFYTGGNGFVYAGQVVRVTGG